MRERIAEEYRPLLRWKIKRYAVINTYAPNNVNHNSFDNTLISRIGFCLIFGAAVAYVTGE